MKEIAIAKIEKELAGFKGQPWEEVMKKEVAAALCNFCKQDETFARAVAEGGSFADCVRSISTSPRQMMSDLEAYRRAVRFFFPGADIEMQMTINLRAGDKPEMPAHGVPRHSGIVLDLTDFL